VYAEDWRAFRDRGGQAAVAAGRPRAANGARRVARARARDEAGY
jgi:hypothetical protein